MCPREGKECNEYMCGNMIDGICGGQKLNCTDCLLDLTDACPRGAGRATDDEICDAFFPRETYEVNKNESWQLGYQQGRADAIKDTELFREIFLEYLINQSVDREEAIMYRIICEMSWSKYLEQLNKQNHFDNADKNV